MHHYIDIHLLPDPEFPTHQLMAALYAKLHRVLAQVQSRTVGVTFPGYESGSASQTLGTTLRLIGPEADLRRLMEMEWLRGMRDHVQATAPAPIPTGVSYRSLRRVQAKSSPERLRRRQIRRHGLTEEQARDRAPDTAAERLNLPWIAMTSHSTGQAFRLYLRLGLSAPTEAHGEFNAYGLSHTATVPWF